MAMSMYAGGSMGQATPAFEDFFSGTKWGSLGGNAGNLGYGSAPRVMPAMPAQRRMTMEKPGPTKPATTASAGTGNARVDDARNQMYSLAQARFADQQNDPVDKMIQSKLMSRLGGGPYTTDTTNAMFTQQAEMAAAAESAQNERMHGNPNDPSFQAAQAENLANRQAAMQRARLDVDSKASIANYAAQGQAVDSLNSYNTGRQARLSDASNYLSGLYSHEYAQGPGTTPGAGTAGAFAMPGMPSGGMPQTSPLPATGGFRQMILPGGSGQGRGGSAVYSTNLQDDPFFSEAPSKTGGMITGTVNPGSYTPEMQEYNARVNPKGTGGMTAADREKRLGVLMGSYGDSYTK